MFGTEMQQFKETDDTSVNCNEEIEHYEYAYNRAVRRYAKKYKISLEEAFNKLYK